MKFFPFLLLVLLYFTADASSPAYALMYNPAACGTACHMNEGQHNYLDPSSAIESYLLIQMFIVMAFFIVSYTLGRFVRKQVLSPSVSRKLVCLTTLTATYFFSFYLPPSSSFLFAVSLVLVGCIVFLLMIGLLSAPIRNRIPALKTCFLAINRPEDQPYTLMWLATEALATSFVVIAFTWIIYRYFSGYSDSDINIVYSMMLIPILGSSIGDALAEIVGKKWGKHSYKTRALFSSRQYTRSIEGSFMVFLSTLVVGLAVAASSAVQIPNYFWVSLCLLCVALPLTEAKSPHTWDNPFLYSVGYLVIILTLFCFLGIAPIRA